MKFNLFNLIIFHLLLNNGNAQIQDTDEQGDLMDSMPLDLLKIQRRAPLLGGLASGFLGGNKKSGTIAPGIKRSNQQHEDSHPNEHNNINVNNNANVGNGNVHFNNNENKPTSKAGSMNESQFQPDPSYIEMMKDNRAHMVENTGTLSFNTPLNHWALSEDFGSSIWPTESVKSINIGYGNDKNAVNPTRIQESSLTPTALNEIKTKVDNPRVQKYEDSENQIVLS